MILIDTTPLVALIDPRDALHRKATADLDRLARQPLATCAGVLVETCFLLTHSVQRQRLERLLIDLDVQALGPSAEAGPWGEVFRWLAHYADHEPDWVDAELAVAAGRDKKVRVWTYDREFATTWRRLDGSKIPLAVR